jgi:DDE superfamily endonuclease
MGYPTKVQLIQRKQSEQWYINFPAAIAQGMDFSKGEEVLWTIADKGNLILSRKNVPPNPIDLKKNSTLFQELEGIIGSCAEAFDCPQAFQRARRHLLAQLVAFGRHTISSMLRAQNRHHLDWSADYRFYSQDRFDEDAVFNQIRRQVQKTLAKDKPLVVAMDDSLLRKTGRKIHGVRFLRDPLSPPFQVNLVRGLRVLQISAALPQGGGMARMIPVDFQHAVLPAKPRKDAPDQDWQNYKTLKAQTNINSVGYQRIAALRQRMDQGDSARRLVVSVDGRFTNRTFLKQIPERTVIIGRIRKDAVVHQPPASQPALGRKRKYGALLPSPEELLKDSRVPFQSVRAFAAGKTHAFKVKQLGPVVLRLDRAARPVQLMVIKPLGYRLTRGGRLLYRQPAYLMCTDPHMALEEFLQHFLWRWDIEVNFRDEKTLLGVGQAQVRTEPSNQNAPALAVAAYAMLLMASVNAYGKKGVPDRLEQAKWYRRKKKDRATTNELINQLRRELWSAALNPSHFPHFTSSRAPDQKCEKYHVPLSSAAFLSLN